MKIFISKHLATLILPIFIILIWQTVYIFKVFPQFLFPSPKDVLLAFFKDFPVLVKHASYTVSEALLGILFSIIISFITAILMEHSKTLYRILYSSLLVSQSIPSIIIAPLLVIFLGYGILPKIFLVILCCFFPLTISFLDGFNSLDSEFINLLKSMGANKYQIFIHARLPFSIPYFFSGLKISVSYAIISAVISEWMGGNFGLGVYMTKVKSAYAFDKLFAVVLFVCILSLIMIRVVFIIQNKVVFKFFPVKEK